MNDLDIGKICRACGALHGYTPHLPTCSFYHPGLIGNKLADAYAQGVDAHHARASELTYEALTSNDYDRAFLAGMQIAVNNSDSNAAQGK